MTKKDGFTSIDELEKDKIYAGTDPMNNYIFRYLGEGCIEILEATSIYMHYSDPVGVVGKKESLYENPSFLDIDTVMLWKEGSLKEYLKQFYAI